MDTVTQAKLNDFLTANLGDKPFSFVHDDKRKVCTISMPELTKQEYWLLMTLTDRSFPDVKMEFIRPVAARIEGDEPDIKDAGKDQFDALIAEQEALIVRANARITALREKQAGRLAEIAEAEKIEKSK